MLKEIVNFVHFYLNKRSMIIILLVRWYDCYPFVPLLIRKQESILYKLKRMTTLLNPN